MSCINTRFSNGQNFKLNRTICSGVIALLCFQHGRHSSHLGSGTPLVFDRLLPLVTPHLPQKIWISQLRRSSVILRKQKIYSFVICIEVWTLWPWKVGQIKNPGIIHTRSTHGKHLDSLSHLFTSNSTFCVSNMATIAAILDEGWPYF
jgi:hypothetical protein